MKTKTTSGLSADEIALMSDLYVALLLDIAIRHGHATLGNQGEPTIVSPIISDAIDLVDSARSIGCVAFFTKVLPAFGREIDSMLLEDCPVPDDFPYEFLSELTAVFIRERQPDVLRDIRQLSYLFYKYETPIETEAAQAVIESFVEVERQLESLHIDYSHPIIRKARAIISDVLGDLDHLDINPKHGPGAVATGETVVGKTFFKRVYQQLERVYPFTEYMCYSLSHVCDRYRGYPYLEAHRTGTAKVVLVPKDSRGPRLISCEPLEYQWIQQGLSSKIVQRLESHPLTRGHVNFTSQDVNRQLALEGSISHEWDSLDMKDASDRVSMSLVTALFSGTRALKGMRACRTSATVLPDGVTVRLRKFAPMGSALCFPVESLVFYALSVSALQCGTGMSQKDASRLVYVYGDDLIIKSRYSSLVLAYLPKFGLAFNLKKCATARTHFRESCGMDAYKGVQVSPIRVKKRWSSRLNPTGLAAYIALSNALYERRYHVASECVENYIRSQRADIPYSETLRGYLTFVRPYASLALNASLPGWSRRFRRDYQRYYVRAVSLVPVVVKTPHDSWEHVLRRFSIGGQETRAGVYSLPRRAKLKRGWYPE